MAVARSPAAPAFPKPIQPGQRLLLAASDGSTGPLRTGAAPTWGAGVPGARPVGRSPSPFPPLEAVSWRGGGSWGVHAGWPASLTFQGSAESTRWRAGKAGATGTLLRG